MPSIMSTSVLLVDDHKIVREGICSLLRAQDDVEVVAQAEDGRAGVERAAALRPDVVVMDVAMPDLNGVDATRQIRAKSPGTRVVVLSAHVDRRTAAAALEAGASGIVPKDAAFEELATAVRTVADDKVYISPQIAGGLIGDLVGGGAAAMASHGPGDGRGVYKALSPREREVLQLMAQGRATKEIARDLGVSVKTVETHRRQIMEKLELYSVAELTRYAVREGLVSL